MRDVKGVMRLIVKRSAKTHIKHFNICHFSLATS